MASKIDEWCPILKSSFHVKKSVKTNGQSSVRLEERNDRALSYPLRQIFFGKNRLFYTSETEKNPGIQLFLHYLMILTQHIFRDTDYYVYPTWMQRLNMNSMEADLLIYIGYCEIKGRDNVWMKSIFCCSSPYIKTDIFSIKK